MLPQVLILTVELQNKYIKYSINIVIEHFGTDANCYRLIRCWFYY